MTNRNNKNKFEKQDEQEKMNEKVNKNAEDKHEDENTGAEIDSSTSNENATNGSEDSVNTKTPSPEELLQQEKEKYLYLYAQFENYKKRVQKEQQDLRKYGWSSHFLDLLAIVDNFERSLHYTSEEEKKSPFVQGVQMILQQIHQFFDQYGVRKVSQNKKFDPTYHDAADNEASDKVPEGEIIRTELDGYMIHDRVLRPARVIVSSGKKD